MNKQETPFELYLKKCREDCGSNDGFGNPDGMVGSCHYCREFKNRLFKTCVEVSTLLYNYSRLKGE